VDANAAALELLCLACEDEIGMFEKTFVHVVLKLHFFVEVILDDLIHIKYQEINVICSALYLMIH